MLFHAGYSNVVRHNKYFINLNFPHCLTIINKPEIVLKLQLKFGLKFDFNGNCIATGNFTPCLFS